MWQRIQTLYLALSTALIAALFFCNKAGDIPYTRYMPYVVLLAIITLLNLLALTTWKHRVFQARTAMLSAIITLALQVWLAVDFFTTGVLGLSAIPLVAVAFCREWLTRLVFGSDVYARQEEISERKQGAAKLLIGLLLANILYFIIFVWIEAAGTRPFAFCAVRAAISSLAGTVAGFFALRLLNSVEDARWK